jgi:hypothetical protein
MCSHYPTKNWIFFLFKSQCRIIQVKFIFFFNGEETSQWVLRDRWAQGCASSAVQMLSLEFFHIGCFVHKLCQFQMPTWLLMADLYSQCWMMPPRALTRPPEGLYFAVDLDHYFGPFLAHVLSFFNNFFFQFLDELCFKFYILVLFNI